MKVLIATKNLHSDSKIRGIGVYARELSQALARQFPQDSFPLGQSVSSTPDLDLIHYPFFDPFFLTLPIHKKIPTVVTIHDLIPLKYPAHYPVGVRGKLKWLRQKRQAQKAAHIITDSTASKSDITSILGIDESKISVIPLGPEKTKVSAELTRKTKLEYNLPHRYLLYVGDINWNKNIIGLVQAFAGLDAPSTHLVLVGKSFSNESNIPESRAVHRAIKDSGKADKIHLLGFVPTHHLPAIYSHATLYVQPSWDEGFGLPVLDAMSRGCPVATSNRGSLPEVGGRSVAYFDPDKDMLEVLSNLLASPEKRKQLAKSGLARAKQFSWELAAIETRKVYEKVIADYS
jgi:glycosyltransferase involved in cell wall biosynthesis